MKLKNLQALRALAALLVVSDHLPRDEAKIFSHGLMAGVNAAGAIGVDLFFVISGFIMIVTTRNSFGRPGAAREFIERRALRIYPPYWIAMSTFVAMALLAPRVEHANPFTAWDFLASLLLVPHAVGPIMFVAWSLQFEMYFYLVFTFALGFARRYLAVIVAVWIAITLACNVAFDFGQRNVAIGFVGNPLSLEFMTGIGVGTLVLSRKTFAPFAMLALGAILLVPVIIYSARYVGFDTPWLEWYRVLFATPGIALIVYSVCTIEQQFNKSVPQIFVHIGDASYTMYLWHGMLLGAFTAAFARLHPHGRLADIVFDCGGYVVVVAGSLIIYRVLELPLLRLFRRAGAGAPRERLDAAS